MVYLFLCYEENTGVNNYAEVTTPRVNTTDRPPFRDEERHKESNSCLSSNNYKERNPLLSHSQGSTARSRR